ncbi:YdcF family protein [Allorhizobium undicola]|uniref:YdcF family protein n=1 Tax=Allorhizobium undicola TaxID=78527 RepID=UPI00068778C8|nr:YdcF family protein [Allorhizobium undicola]
MILRRKDSQNRLQSAHRAEGLFSPHGRLRRVLRYGGYLMLAVIALLVAGFLHFADQVTLMVPPENPKADAIVVLTGGYQRIDTAIELLERKAGQRLLISGVDPNTTPSQIRRMTQTSPALFNCCVDVGYQAIDTIGNANEATRWINDKHYASVLVVTSNYHMQRSLMELRRLDRQTDFIPYPVVNSDLRTKAWFSDPNALRTLLAEYVKMLLAQGRDIVGWESWSGLRSAMR